MFKNICLLALVAVALAEPTPKAEVIASSAVFPHSASYAVPYSYTRPYHYGYNSMYNNYRYRSMYNNYRYNPMYNEGYLSMNKHGYNSIENFHQYAVEGYAPYNTGHYGSMYRSTHNYPHYTSAQNIYPHPYNMY